MLQWQCLNFILSGERKRFIDIDSDKHSRTDSHGLGCRGWCWGVSSSFYTSCWLGLLGSPLSPDCSTVSWQRKRTKLLKKYCWRSRWTLNPKMKKVQVDLSYRGYRLYLHGFVVKTEKGTRCLNSSVICSAKGGLDMKIQHTFEPAHSFTYWGSTLDASWISNKIILEVKPLAWARWWLVQGPQGQEQTQSDCCRGRKHFNTSHEQPYNVSIYIGCKNIVKNNHTGHELSNV